MKTTPATLRRMRGGAVLLTLTGALVAALSVTGQAASKGGHGCSPAHSTLLAATTKARVFQTRVMRDTHVRATYGCLESRKRPVRFVVPDFPTGYDQIRLAGRFVAYVAYSDCAADFCDPNNVIVQDLSNARRSFADGRLSVANVTSLVVRSNGAAAWIQTSFDDNGTSLPGYSVVRAAYGQAPVVLDTGTDIDPGSLALGGSTLYWTKAGAPVSAALG